MTEQFNVLLIALLFMMLIGAWLLINALVDVAARRFRLWIAAHWRWFGGHWGDNEAHNARSSYGDSQTLP
jgi:hypothetical protein